MTANAGTTPQSAAVSTTFANPLSVTLLDAANNPIAGHSVTFIAPGSGASGTFTTGTNTITVVTNASGVAAATFTANATAGGPYTVTAASAGLTSVNFSLTNTGGPATHFSVSAPATATPGTSFNVTVTALDAGGATATGYGGTVHFTSTDGAAALPANSTLTNGMGTFSITLNTAGSQTVTATDTTSSSITGTSGTINVGLKATSTTLTSSLNPSQVGQAVTFTATASSGSGTPSGTVTFKDGAAVLGTGTLSGAGIATITTSSLTLGSHSITASYVGATTFAASTSAVLTQVVNTPTDSLKLRALQVLAAPVAAQVSGQAISGAVDSAVAEGFSGGGTLVTPSSGGVRFNFAADPDGNPTDTVRRSSDPFSSANGSFASGGRSFGARPLSSADSALPEGADSPLPARSNTGSRSRIDGAFGAMADAAPTRAVPRRFEQRDWLGWAEVRGATLDHWGTATLGAATSVPVLYGNQVNLLAGLTRRLMPNFLIGVLGGYETFDYRSDALQGRLRGDGWTAGSYLGWMVTPGVRIHAAVAYSGIGYDGTADTAAGTFSGHRLLVSGGVTGTYQSYGLQVEPSARVFALWERQNAYTDSLGTMQAARDFSTGRASGGVKLAYPITWTSTLTVAPHVGLYGDYYFSNDSAGTPVVAPAIPTPIVFHGWSARAVGGLVAASGTGAQIALGVERGGIGGNFGIWTYRARASVPFGAQ